MRHCWCCLPIYFVTIEFMYFSCHQNLSVLIFQIFHLFNCFFIIIFIFGPCFSCYPDCTKFSTFENFKMHIFVIFRPGDDTLVLKYFVNLTCSVKPSRAQQELELLSKRIFWKIDYFLLKRARESSFKGQSTLPIVSRDPSNS